MQAKCCIELGKHIWMIRFNCSNNIISWVGYKIFDDNTTPNNDHEVIMQCLDEIDKPLYIIL